VRSIRLVPTPGPLNQLAVLVKSQAQIFSAGWRRHRSSRANSRGGVTAVTSRAKPKAEGDHRASADAMGKFMPHVEAGKLRVLVLSRKCSLFPNVPRMKDLGYKEDMFSSWFSLTAPAGIPEEAKKLLIPAVEKSINNPESKSKIENRGYIVDYKSPGELKKIIESDYETIRALAARLGLTK
jgi:tripartite-type tricarboxylate transporter receptor subunit TctC